MQHQSIIFILHKRYPFFIFLFSLLLILNLYKQNNNCITQDILLNYLNSLDKNSKIYQLLSTRGERYLNEIVNSGSLQFHKRQRYVIGTILASDFHNKIKDNPGKISELCYLIDILGHTDLLADNDLKILSNLDIPIINNGKLSVSENDIIRLKQNIEKLEDEKYEYENQNVDNNIWIAKFKEQKEAQMRFFL